MVNVSSPWENYAKDTRFSHYILYSSSKAYLLLLTLTHSQTLNPAVSDEKQIVF